MTNAPDSTLTERQAVSPSLRRRVLIVVSAYRPVVVADMHRARMLSWELPKLGWDVEILTPAAAYHRANIIETTADPFFPADVPVHEVAQSLPGLFRSLAIGSVAFRSIGPMYRRGCQLLAEGRFDLVYISTTNFPLFCLGPAWKHRFQTPYILDFHDPWHRTGGYVTSDRPVKWRLNQWLSRWLERISVTEAAGLVAVSPQYLDDLLGRHHARSPAWTDPARRAAIPFGGSPRDLESAALSENPWRARFNDGRLHVVYVGAGGLSMRRGMIALCEAVRAVRATEPELVKRVRFHLFGTEAFWKPGDARLLQDIAAEHGVGDLVAEEPERREYLDALHLAQAAQGLLVLGVDDAGYVPSKLINYLLVGPPLVGVFHACSPVWDLLRGDLPHVFGLRFGAAGDDRATAENCTTLVNFLRSMSAGDQADRQKALQERLSPAMAEEHTQLFERCVIMTKDPTHA